MEMPEPWCGIRYDRGEREEEELTLTPHHTPSQSFDFIVWEKAYLDNIPAAGSKDAPPTPNPNFDGPPSFDATSMCVHRPSSEPSSSSSSSSSSICVHISSSHNPKLSLPKKSLQKPPSLQTTLMACKTDADLPPSFIIDKPRSSDAGLTSLEEAVQSYARKHPHTIGSPSPTSRRNTGHCPHCGTRDTIAQLNTANHEGLAALLRRSHSQPGGSNSKGLSSMGLFKQPIASKDSLAADCAVFGHARIHQDWQYYAAPVPPPPPTRNHSTWSCFPASPGRRKRAQSDCEAMQWADISENATLDQLHWQQERLRSPVDIHQQQNYKLLSPAAWADAMHRRSGWHVPAGGWPVGMHVDLGAVAPGSDQNSFSDMSSDCDHHHDAGASALHMSKIKLWGLHHRFKALCKKLCSFCTL